MLSQKKIATTLVAMSLSLCLLGGSAGVAFGAFNIDSSEKNGDAVSTAISTRSISTEKKLNLSKAEKKKTSAQLLKPASRKVPTKTVTEADASKNLTDALAKKLAAAKAVDASDYEAGLSEDVEWSSCVASSYGIGDGLLGSGTANGEKVTKTSMCVAHKTLPIGTKVLIKYKGKIVKVTVNDRGPYIEGREFDLQPAVAWAIGFDGLATIEYSVVK